jgi:hypothetical protein
MKKAVRTNFTIFSSKWHRCAAFALYIKDRNGRNKVPFGYGVLLPVEKSATGHFKRDNFRIAGHTA